MKKNDIVLILAIALCSVLVMLAARTDSTSPDMVEVTCSNTLYGEYPLYEDREIDIGGKNIISIKNGEVYMKGADCPDQICVKQKPLSSGGRAIICLPNGILVRVTSGRKLPDAVSGNNMENIDSEREGDAGNEK